MPISFTGNPPWSVSYTDGTNTLSQTNITQNPFYVNVAPATNTTYTLVSMSDAQCVGTVSGMADVPFCQGVAEVAERAIRVGPVPAFHSPLAALKTTERAV